MNLENSQGYCDKVLSRSEDLLTDACCTAEAPPPQTAVGPNGAAADAGAFC